MTVKHKKHVAEHQKELDKIFAEIVYMAELPRNLDEWTVEHWINYPAQPIRETDVKRYKNAEIAAEIMKSPLMKVMK
jgi:hypothetical protein